MPFRLQAGPAGEAERLREERRFFHTIAELGFQERRTQAAIIERLRAAGLTRIETLGGTGVVAVVEGASASGRGRSVLWRADIDGLPLREETGLPFAADGAAMHACGHDGHIAVALGLARLLQTAASTPGGLRGRVVLVFQPAEELGAGAEAMLSDGLLERFPADVALGFHVSADLQPGLVNVTDGPVMAAVTDLRCTVRGHGGHGALPHQAVDAIVAASHLVVAWQTVVSRNVPPDRSAALTIGTIHGGQKENIIAAEVALSGTVRTFEDGVRERVLRRVEEIAHGVAAAMGAEVELQMETRPPAVVNDPHVSTRVRTAATAVVGPDAVVSGRTTGGDDMALFLQRVPGCYFMVGMQPKAGPHYPHHHARFDFDDRYLALALELAWEAVRGELESR